MTLMPLETPNLRLVPFTPADLLTLIESPERFEDSFGFPMDDALRGFYVSDDVSPAWLAVLRTSPVTTAWVHGFAVLHRVREMVIGSAGFKGPPDPEGVVEIAYGIVPPFEGHGYATEAAAALVDFAFAHREVRRVRAHTLPEANASTHVLEKCGFAKVGDVVDPEDGPVWRWERNRPPA
jgi:ribosomal-protein-alanine N-acetyltransferase